MKRPSYSRRVVATLLFFLSVGATLEIGCGHSTIKAQLDRDSRSDDDLVALLPHGLDAVIDVDVAGLRQLDTAPLLLQILPEQALSRLQVVSDQPLADFDALVVGLLGMGTGDPEVVWVARGTAGHVKRERVFAGLQKLGPSTEAEYHGLPLIETTSGQAAAMLTPRTAVYGNRQSVRQVIDNFRGDDEGARQQVDLMQAVEKAPRAKEGRPAVLMGILLTPPLREKLRQLELPELGTDADFLAVALAAGDGIDLGVVAGYKTLPAAQEAAKSLKNRVAGLRQRPALSFLGIEKLIEPFIAVAVPAGKKRATPELHLAYRLPGGDLAALLGRLQKLQQLQKQLRGGS